MNNIIFLWDSFYPRLFALLVNTAWQLTLLVMLILLSIFLLKIRTAAMRHGLWLMVVFSPLFLPLLNLFVPAVNIHLSQHRPNEIVYEETSLPQKYPTAIPLPAYRLPGKTTESSDAKVDTRQKSSSINKEQPGVTASESRFALPISFKKILLLLWMLGAFGMAARLAKGLHGLRSLRKNAVYVENDSIINLLDELRNSFSIQRKIQLATSDRLTYPVSFGWRKPIILMPSNFADTMSKASVRMTLIHELAHFKRRDYPINIANSFLRIPLFFHPLFIFATKQLQIQQEHICDDWVIQFSQKRTTPKESEGSIGIRWAYAQCLLRQAEVAILKNAPSFGASVVSGFKNMRRRIDMILDKKRALSINLSKKATILVLLICCVFTALAATTRLLPFALAQQTEEEKLITQIKETLRWYPVDEELSQEQRTAAYRKNSEKGLTLCQQFLEKYPQHEYAVKVKLDQVSFLARLRRYDEVEQLVREFLAKYPTDPYADGFRWTLVNIYKSKGEYDAALAELELIKEPEWAVHWERNQIYQQREETQLNLVKASLEQPVLKSLGRLKGRVIGINGKPLVNIKLILDQLLPENVTINSYNYIKVDADGTFSLDIPNFEGYRVNEVDTGEFHIGLYGLVGGAIRHADTSVTLKIGEQASNIVFDLREKPNPLRVRVVDLEGQPVEGAKVAFHLRYPDGGGHSFGESYDGKDISYFLTDAEGLTPMLHLSNFHYVFEVVADNFRKLNRSPIKVPEEIPEDGIIEIQLEQGGRIAGHVVDSKGAPVANAKLAIRSYKSDKKSRGGGRYINLSYTAPDDVFTDAEGQFAFTTLEPVGSYCLHAYCEGYGVDCLLDVPVGTEDAVLHLMPVVSLCGTVLKDSKPVAILEKDFVPALDNKIAIDFVESKGQYAKFNDRRIHPYRSCKIRIFTDDSGAFRVDYLVPRATYKLTIPFEDKEYVHTVTLGEDAETYMTFELD